MSKISISAHPPLATAVALLRGSGLPTEDLTESHLQHFFAAGQPESPVGLVGVQLCSGGALLRSLVVDPRARTTGIGSQLVAHAEAYARARGMPSIYLLTTTAEAFFAARGYAHRPSGRTTEHSVHARVFRLMPGKLRIHGQASTGVTEMKRLHVHVAVENLEASIRFYSHLFSTEPTIRKDDYAKWMLDDPRVNFAISARGATAGVEHLGIQVENRVELADVYSRLQRADGPVLEEGVTTCCYAKSEKSWIEDPQGVKWETFLTTGESTTYGSDTVKAPPSTCCPSKAA